MAEKDKYDGAPHLGGEKVGGGHGKSVILVINSKGVCNFIKKVRDLADKNLAKLVKGMVSNPDDVMKALK